MSVERLRDTTDTRKTKILVMLSLIAIHAQHVDCTVAQQAVLELGSELGSGLCLVLHAVSSF